MTDAAVGSISHILQTAFKEDIDERKKLDEYKIKKEQRLAKQQAREERRRLKEEALAAQKAEEEALAAAAASSKKGKPPPKPASHEEPAGDEEAAGESAEEASEEEEEEELVENPVDVLPLAEHHKEALLAAKEEIRRELEDNSKNAEELVSYLKDQRDIARRLEIEEEENLKQQGIMVGQHIPSLTSQLDINPSVLNSFGRLSSNLVVSKQLLDQNKERNLRRTGNLPISDDAELRKSMRKQYKSSLEDDAPHYLEHTGTFKERANVTTARFASTLKEHKTLRETVKLDRSSKGLDTKTSIPKRERGQSMQDKARDEAVLKAINHKLNYLRNPRNNPSTVSRTLIAPKPSAAGAFNSGASTAFPSAGDRSTASADTTTPPKPPSPATVRRTAPKGPTSSQHQQQPGTMTRRGAGSGSAMTAGNALFLTEPSVVMFDAYTVGETYSTSISFRNISAVSRSLRVIPPRTNSFCMAPLQFPVHSKAGMVAPGMCVISEITFMPTSLADYNDKLLVETEGGSYEVPIMGRRDPPVLNLPSLLDIGACLVGDSMRISTPCTNTGGAGKFKIMKSDWYPTIPDDVDYNGCIRAAPFTVYPIEFSLGRHETVDLTIEFVPLEIGSFEQDFVFLGDNDQYITVTLQAQGREVDCAIVEVNSVSIPPKDSSILTDLHFSECSIGNDVEQEISIANTTGLAIEYEWVWMESRTKDIRRSALAKMLISEEQQEEKVERQLIKEEAAAASRKRRGSLRERRGSKATIEEYPADDMLMMSTGGLDIEDGFDLSSRMNGFEISPGRGVLPAYGNAPFVVKFTAAGVGMDSARAVLMLKEVTEPSLPEKGQDACLQKLLDKGHGPYHRVRSWVEEIGTPVPHEQTKHELDDLFLKGLRPDNVPSNRVSLDTLMTIARTHAKNSCSERAQTRFKFAVGRILSKAKRWMNRITDDDIPDDDSVCGPDTLLHSEEEIVLDDAVAMANLLVWNPDEDDSMATIYPTFTVQLPTEIPENIKENRRYVNPTSMEAKNLGKLLWLDSYSAFSLLGSEFCQVLDQKVKHEAVEFIQRVARVSLPVLNMNITGEGVLPTFEVSPPKIVAGGKLSVGSKWETQVTLKNTSQIMNEVTIDPATAIALGLKSQGNAEIEVSNQNVILMPGSSETIDISIITREIGNFEFHLPVNAKNQYLDIDDIIISLQTIGPKVRFEASEVNLGLVSTGTETRSLLSFTNDTDVPLLFNLTCTVDATGNVTGIGPAQIKGNGSPSKTSRKDDDTHSVANSARSSRSQMTEGSVDSFGIENPTAHLIFEPPQGQLAPGETCQAMLKCLAGKFPQRIRGIAECAISDITGICQLPSQFISVRGEVQSPLTILTPTLVDLGQVYINTPVEFVIVVKNLTSLPSKFKFERPGGDSASYRLKFSEKSGELEGQESRKIKVNFTALVSGVTDEVIGCKIFGAPNPIGFQLKVITKGIQVEFIPLEDGEESPEPLADPTEAQYPGPGPVPEPAPTKPLDMGQTVELYERQYKQFVIRNLSAMSAHFEIRPKKYDVGEMFADVDDDASLTSSMVGPPESGQGLLVPKEEGEFRYHSQEGKKYIGAILKRRQDKHYLTLGLGASYSIEPRSGMVEPWGVVVVNVLARNDMPGCFDDELVCDIKDHRKLYLPVKMTVLGCPLVIERDSYGMSSFTPPGGAEEGSSGLLLQMGYSPVNSDPIVRDFRVRNNGSSPATIKWNLRSVASKVNGPIKFELHLSEDGSLMKAKSHFLYWDDVAKDSPFDVGPKVSVIPPYGRKNFKVKLLRTNAVGNELALLSGAISFDGDTDFAGSTITRRRSSQISVESRPGTAEGLQENASAASIASHSTAKSNAQKVTYSISLHLKGSLVQPEIRLDKHVLTTSKEAVTRVDPAKGINLKTDAPRLFAKGVHPSEVCKKVIALTNPIPATLAFSVSVEGPYTIKLVTDEGAAKAASKAKTKVASDADSAVTSKSQSSLVSRGARTQASTSGGSSVGSTCVLLAHATARFEVAFTPKRELRNAVAGNKGVLGQGDDAAANEKGTMIVSFSTGQQLHVPIAVTLRTPFIAASSPRLNFGVCHTTHSCDGTILLSTPTDVVARWSVVHVPGAGGSRKVSSIRVKGFESVGGQEDDPSVFHITPDTGELQGPTVSPSAATYCPPNDVNRKSEIAVIEQRPIKTSWATMKLTMNDSLVERHQSSRKNEIDARYPIPISIAFKPSRNVKYSSRFRFSCEYGNSFDVLLEGVGTFEEHEHKPLYPVPR